MEKKDRSFQNGLLIGISATLAVVAVLVVAGTFFLLPNLLSSRQKTGGQDNGEASWTEKIQEIRLVNRAKWALIQCLGMSEDETHHYIEKLAMDHRISKREAASRILAVYGSSSSSGRPSESL